MHAGPWLHSHQLVVNQQTVSNSPPLTVRGAGRTADRRDVTSELLVKPAAGPPGRYAAILLDGCDETRLEEATAGLLPSAMETITLRTNERLCRNGKCIYTRATPSEPESCWKASPHSLHECIGGMSPVTDQADLGSHANLGETYLRNPDWLEPGLNKSASQP